MPRIGGRQKDPFNEISWAPPKKYTKTKESVLIASAERLKRDRILQGYKDLFQVVHNRKPDAHEMNTINKTIKKLNL